MLQQSRIIQMRLFFTIVFIGLCSLSANADSRVGFRSGVNFGNVRYHNIEERDPHTKNGVVLNAAIQGALASSRIVFLQGEVGFVDRGWVENAEIHSDEVETFFLVPEISMGIAILMRYPSAGVKPFIEFGIDYSAVVRREAYAEYAGTEMRAEISDYSSYNICSNIGGGFAIPTGRNELQLAIRYNKGLTSVLNTLDDVSVKTTGIQLLAGYFFTLNR